jgi:hypothetical protein
MLLEHLLRRAHPLPAQLWSLSSVPQPRKYHFRFEASSAPTAIAENSTSMLT